MKRCSLSACAAGWALLLALVRPLSASAEEPRRDEPGVAWKQGWPRFRLPEYLGTAAMGLSSYYVRYHLLGDTAIKWQGSNFFDDGARRWLRADTPEGRRQASDVGGWVATSGAVFPFVVDLPVLLFVHREAEVTWQVLMMDLEAFAFTSLVNNLLFYEVGRGRPSAPDCAANPAYDPSCGQGPGSSFPSGHVVTIATGAGLTCVHHRYLPIYGDARADAAACVLLTAATATTAFTRVIGDRHYATDTLVAAVLGFGAGYGLPWLLHYRVGAGTAGEHAQGKDQPTRPVALLPFGGAGQLGLGVFGLL